MGSDTRSRMRIFLLAVTTLVISSAEADVPKSPADFGARRSSAIFRGLLGDDASGGGKIPLDLLELLAAMPISMQRQMLREFGQEMVDQGAANCNIFGGQASCQALSANSAYHALCPNYPLTVDCAFYHDSMMEIDDDPTKDMRDEAAKVGAALCASCEENLEELYCAQAVPKCGTFQTHVELVFLPLLRDVARAKQHDNDFQPAIERLMPRVLNATGLVSPCKEYCEAVTASCACGNNLKFGAVIEMLEKAQLERTIEDLPQLPAGTFEKMFEQFNDRPLCDMYQPQDTRGFIGHCPTSPLSKDTCHWCGTSGSSATKPAMPQFVEEYLANALVNGMLGWLIGPEGLLADADFFADGDGDYEFEHKHGGGGLKPDEHESHHKKHHGHHGKARAGAIFFRWVVGLVLLGAGGYGGWMLWEKRKLGGGDTYFGSGARDAGYAPVHGFADPDFDDFENQLEVAPVPLEPGRTEGA